MKNHLNEINSLEKNHGLQRKTESQILRISSFKMDYRVPLEKNYGVTQNYKASNCLHLKWTTE